MDFPFYFRIGSVGAGVGIGCGVGIGFGQPLSLGAVPGVSQAVAGVSSGLGQASGALGGASMGAREVVRRLGIKGLDAGIGCGVGVGYGFGAGLFIKPSAAEELLRLVESTAGSLMRRVQVKLQEAGVQVPGAAPQQQQPEAAPPRAPGFSSRSDHEAPGAGPQLHAPPVPPPPNDTRSHSVGQAASSHQQPVLPPSPSAAQPLDSRAEQGGSLPAVTMLLPPALSGLHSASGHALPPGGVSGRGWKAGPYAGTAAATTNAPERHPAQNAASGASARGEAAPEEFRALLRHEREIARLKAQNRALRRAVCKLDRRLSLCTAGSGSEDSGSGME